MIHVHLQHAGQPSSHAMSMQQGHSKGQARWVAAQGTNLQGTPRYHWYNNNIY